jgi:protein-tyrosine phosphatase
MQQPHTRLDQPYTSETHPIRVDFLPDTAMQLPGKLGMTIAPGKQHRGMLFDWHRNLHADLIRLKDHYNTDLLVSLIEKPEMHHLRVPNLLTAVQAQDMQSLWFPIQDFGTPTSMQGLNALVQDILSTVQGGKTVVVHCRGGLGRSGLVVASCLVTRGYSPDDAFALVRATRPGSVETVAQEAYVHEFAARWSHRHPS